MYSVILIGTSHSEKGKCNPYELYKILEDIQPEVIFDELPISAAAMFYGEDFDFFYSNSLLINRHHLKIPLEVKSVKKYQQHYNVEIVPVDIDVTGTSSEHRDEVLFLFSLFFENKKYNELDIEKETLIAQEGFQYLNSDEFLDLLRRKEDIEKNIIDLHVDKDRLLYIYNAFYTEECDKREYAMLDNLYNYSINNQYNQAVLLLGADHKKSIMPKIFEYDKQSEIKLNWRMYGS